MCYILINTIEKIIDYEVQHNFVIKEGKVLNICRNIILKNIENQREIYSFGNNYIISKDIRGNSYIINTNNLSTDNRFKIDANKFPYFTFYEIDKKSIEGVYDYNKNNILFTTTEWIGRDIIEDYIFSDYQGIITCRDIFSGNPLWQYDLSQLGTYQEQYSNEAKPYKVEKFIGIWQDYLIAGLSNNALLFIEIKSGKAAIPPGFEKYTQDKPPLLFLKTKPMGHPVITGIPAHRLKPDLKNNKIVNPYVEIDLQQGEIKYMDFTKNLKVENKKEYHYSGDFDFDDDYIYIPIDRNYYTELEKPPRLSEHLFILDRKTREQVWQTEIKGSDICRKIKVNKDKIYFLDHGGNLHIFEKTENINI